ncbi:GAF domain-containing sensor histidine kinase [Pedobacter sp. L105]|uniref:GAF domain-containing sensor histidine kinase n=1 Tax=Pedobacter sp. L105 TaxID=1641871 RepID=UPI0020B1426A|nr:GAF domain-containing sensor histidine kinase [Pedobacter sp. L105]
MTEEKLDIAKEVAIINRIPIVNTLLELMCEFTGMRFAFIARVTKTQWLACAVKDEINFGVLPGSELVLESTICHEVESHHQVVAFDEASTDPQFFCHPTPKAYGFESYISVPIILPDNSFYGTLCALDPKSAVVNTPKIIGMFIMFADLVAQHVGNGKKLLETEQSLNQEKETSELRDQFIAVLGHDLRNPVGAIRNSAQFLLRMPVDERTSRFLHIIQNSTYRITALIDNVLDFAKSRLGDGLLISRNTTNDLENVLLQVINELRVIWPDRIVNTQFELNDAVNCDPIRIAQLLSNILGNALSHGDASLPVKVLAVSNQNEFKICVYNKGAKIPEDIIDRLFLPFSRGNAERNKEGLGLGLFISSEIAKAHGGSISVTSTDDETCFTCLFSNS